MVPLRVNTVVVDTIQQKLYDIKPLQEVEKNYEALIAPSPLGLGYLPWR